MIEVVIFVQIFFKALDKVIWYVGQNKAGLVFHAYLGN